MSLLYASQIEKSSIEFIEKFNESTTLKFVDSISIIELEEPTANPEYFKVLRVKRKAKVKKGDQYLNCFKKGTNSQNGY
jgi:hypothetical protein